MKLLELHAVRYKSLRDVFLQVGPLTVLIGANASGKSNLLDALRLLTEGVREKDFGSAINERRGRIQHLAWKGEDAQSVEISTRFRTEQGEYVWNVEFIRSPADFQVRERVIFEGSGDAPKEYLNAHAGKGWWWSKESKVPLEHSSTGCALAAAAADASFPAREIAEYVAGWTFLDPSPGLLRRASLEGDSLRLDASGRNLAARLKLLSDTRPEIFQSICQATRDILGVPESITFRTNEDGWVYFTQTERGLNYRVHQVGVSSGTLRLLALLTALLGESKSGLVGIEEPENYVHPTALASLVDYLQAASRNEQIVITTHSPLILDRLNDPEIICVVSRTEHGTELTREDQPDAVRQALEQSGFGLGEFFQTKGFGA